VKEPFPGRTWPDTAREIESLGYSTLFVPDHFHSGYGPIAAMTAAAMATTTLTVGSLVLACDFRNPAVMAKELATIDLLSEGRLEVGLGAGYNPLDYSRSGVRMDPPGVRVARLFEHTRVLRLLFADGEANFDGQHYRIEALDGNPTPHTPGGPPILLAGGGPRLLRFAAAEADIIGVNPTTAAGRDSPETARDALPSSIDAKFAIIREAAGDRFETLEFNSWLSIASITDNSRDTAEQLSGFFAAEPSEVLDSPLLLLGSEDEVVEQLQRRRNRWGYSYTVIPGDKAHEFAPVVQRLAGH
jgi:probable F420-dependent oxidoreductase